MRFRELDPRAACCRSPAPHRYERGRDSNPSACLLDFLVCVDPAFSTIRHRREARAHRPRAAQVTIDLPPLVVRWQRYRAQLEPGRRSARPWPSEGYVSRRNGARTPGPAASSPAAQAKRRSIRFRPTTLNGCCAPAACATAGAQAEAIPGREALRIDAASPGCGNCSAAHRGLASRKLLSRSPPERRARACAPDRQCPGAGRPRRRLPPSHVQRALAWRR